MVNSRLSMLRAQWEFPWEYIHLGLLAVLALWCRDSLERKHVQSRWVVLSVAGSAASLDPKPHLNKTLHWSPAFVISVRFSYMHGNMDLTTSMNWDLNSQLTMTNAQEWEGYLLLCPTGILFNLRHFTALWKVTVIYEILFLIIHHLLCCSSPLSL